MKTVESLLEEGRKEQLELDSLMKELLLSETDPDKKTIVLMQIVVKMAYSIALALTILEIQNRLLKAN